MILGERLRTVREQKELSQGDVEKRSGLLRCYISREKNGHTVPAVDRKSTRLNSRHSQISYAVFCLKQHPGKHRRGNATPPRRSSGCPKRREQLVGKRVRATALDEPNRHVRSGHPLAPELCRRLHSK